MSSSEYYTRCTGTRHTYKPPRRTAHTCPPAAPTALRYRARQTIHGKQTTSHKAMYATQEEFSWYTTLKACTRMMTQSVKKLHARVLRTARRTKRRYRIASGPHERTSRCPAPMMRTSGQYVPSCGARNTCRPKKHTTHARPRRDGFRNGSATMHEQVPSINQRRIGLVRTMLNHKAHIISADKYDARKIVNNAVSIAKCSGDVRYMTRALPSKRTQSTIINRNHI